MEALEYCMKSVQSQHKDTRTASMTFWFWCLYCKLSTDFTHCFGVLIADFERVNASWVENISATLIDLLI